MTDWMHRASVVLAAFLTFTGIALLGMAIGFGLSPPIMANYVECGPIVGRGCLTAAGKMNDFALYSLVGGFVVTACGGLGIASLWDEGA